MSELPIDILRAAQVRELDRAAIEDHQIPGYTLMYRAGEAAFRQLQIRWPKARNILVLCGAGNNAGDGYVLARIAKAERLHVSVAALCDPARLTGDAQVAWGTYHSAGGQVSEWDPGLLQWADVVVDAILGTGLTRPLAGRSCDLVQAVNESGVPVLALDVPTGLHADTGQVMGAAIRADATITFVGLKLGLYTGNAWDYTGEILFDALDIPRSVGDRLQIAARRLNVDVVRTVLPRRTRISHKGDNGRVLLIGGGQGMPGAVRLAGEAALRAGAGLVVVATHPDNAVGIASGCPELICRGVSSGAALRKLMEEADVVGLGPGLGRDPWAQQLFQSAMSGGHPLVLDADALNLLAMAPMKRGNCVLTPHPGEAGRLLNVSPGDIQSNRVAAVARLLERFGGVVVLKGAGTLVGKAGAVPWICDRGNAGMATAGMGDVLTGVICGIAAQRGDLFDAARAGVYVHSSAADDAAAGRERGLMASDLFQAIRDRVNVY